MLENVVLSTSVKEGEPTAPVLGERLTDPVWVIVVGSAIRLSIDYFFYRVNSLYLLD